MRRRGAKRAQAFTTRLGTVTVRRSHRGRLQDRRRRQAEEKRQPMVGRRRERDHGHPVMLDEQQDRRLPPVASGSLNAQIWAAPLDWAAENVLLDPVIRHAQRVLSLITRRCRCRMRQEIVSRWRQAIRDGLTTTDAGRAATQRGENERGCL